MARRSQTRFLVRAISGAQPLKVTPGFIEPALATLRSSPPPGDRWIHEIKFDGYRVEEATPLALAATTITISVHMARSSD